MRKPRFAGSTAAALLTVVLVTGCTDQDQTGTAEPTESVAAASAAPVTGTYTGTQVFELGAAPAEVTEIAVEITCLDPGTLALPGGAQVTCKEDGEQTTTAIWSLPLSAGQHSLEVRASGPAVRYGVKIAYADS